MSNRVTLVRTQFTDTDTETRDTSYGYRIYDDYSAAYRMYSEGIKAPDDDGELFLDAIQAGEDVGDLTEWATINGIVIDDTFYDAEELANMMAKAKRRTDDNANHRNKTQADL